MRIQIQCALIAASLAALAPALSAQQVVPGDSTSAAAAAIAATPPRIAFGLSTGAFGWSDGQRQEALGAVVQLRPLSWLVVGANPSVVRAAGTGGQPARTGLADLPLFAGASARLGSLPWSPSLGVAAVAVLPVGDSASGFGSGETSTSAELVAGVTPLPALTVRAGASRVLRSSARQAVGAPATALAADATISLGSRTTIGAGWAAELGRGDSSYVPARTVSGTVTFALHGWTALMLGAGHTLRGAGPQWMLTIGIGSAFAGLSPVGITSPLDRASGGVPQHGSLGGVGGTLCRLGGTC